MNKNMRQNLTMFSVATTIKMKNIFLNLLINTQKDILYPELSFLLRYKHHLCQRSFYKIFVKFRNSKKNVLKIVLIIVNINKDENKSLISN